MSTDTPFQLNLLKALEYCPNVLYVYDLLNHKNVYSNREITTVLGYTAEEVRAMGAELFNILLHPDDFPTVISHQQHVAEAADGQVVPIEYRMLNKDKTYRWLVSRDVVYQRTPDGRVSHYLGIVDDITEKRAALDWAQRALNLTPVLVYVFDLTTQQNVYSNGLIGEMLGYSPDDIQAMGSALIPTIMHPDDLARFPGMLKQIAVAKDEDALDFTYRMKRSNGEWAWLQDKVRVFQRGANNDVVQYMGAIQDVTQRKAEEAERAGLQQQIIEAQQAALREISTPLIPIAEGVMVMPLIGTIDPQRAHQVVEKLLHGVNEARATTVILDITGVELVDSHVAAVLLQAAQAVKLLGAQVVITGIRPEVAQSLVSLGVSLEGVITRSTLQSGVAYAIKLDRR
jgi:rsbT co-antagonist protein RsbR